MKIYGEPILTPDNKPTGNWRPLPEKQEEYRVALEKILNEEFPCALPPLSLTLFAGLKGVGNAISALFPFLATALPAQTKSETLQFPAGVR